LLINPLMTLLHLVLIDVVIIVLAVLEERQSRREEVAVTMRPAMLLSRVQDTLIVEVTPLRASTS
jgi:hypothetical protein